MESDGKMGPHATDWGKVFGHKETWDESCFIMGKRWWGKVNHETKVGKVVASWEKWPGKVNHETSGNEWFHHGKSVVEKLITQKMEGKVNH